MHLYTYATTTANRFQEHGLVATIREAQIAGFIPIHGLIDENLERGEEFDLGNFWEGADEGQRESCVVRDGDARRLCPA